MRSFKCFEHIRLPLAPLTLLTGFNASGKSTVLQVLLLLHQTMNEDQYSTRLLLNGAMVRLGTLADVVDQLSGKRDEFEIGVEDDFALENSSSDELRLFSSCSWTFGGERYDMSVPVRRVDTGDSHPIEIDPTDLQYMMPRPGKSYPDNMPEGVYPSFFDTNGIIPLVNTIQFLTYISAERAAPQDIYRIVDPHIVKGVGSQGEYVVSVLYQRGDDSISPQLALPNTPHTLFRQVEERMSQFFPGFSMDLRRIPSIDAAMLGVRTSNSTEFHRPSHTGFGLTQVLPIVVAALSAKQGQLLLIENPEIHLHPAGQALMGEFLAEIANAGLQVLVETHSDHVLSGVRRAVKENRLSSEHIAIHFFRSRSDNLPQVHSPNLDHSGNIDDWPEGFFDQFDKDASYFAGWGEDWA